jgi:hypothetical protein
MKVLVLGDYTAQPCGIRNFLDQTYTALARHPGLEVHKWNGHYPELYRRREAGEPCYLPDDAASYDVIHVNWHPIAFNTYGPDHFPAPRLVSTGGYTRMFRRPILSVYLNDIPPWSGCPFHDRAEVRFTAEESPGCVVLPYPVADWIDLPPADPGFSVGCSTVRGDGVWKVKEICEARGWEFRVPDRTTGWLTYEAEVQRIARNTLNALWYFEGRGKSGGLSQAISSQRPVVCSNSQMFTHFDEFRDELYISDGAQPLEELLDQAYRDWEAGTLRTPRRAGQERSWSRATVQMVAAWEEARR